MNVGFLLNSSLKTQIYFCKGLAFSGGKGCDLRVPDSARTGLQPPGPNRTQGGCVWTEGLPPAGVASWSLCTPACGAGGLHMHPHPSRPQRVPASVPGSVRGLAMGPGLRSLSWSPGDSHHWGSGKLVCGF